MSMQSYGRSALQAFVGAYPEIALFSLEKRNICDSGSDLTTRTIIGAYYNLTSILRYELFVNLHHPVQNGEYVSVRIGNGIVPSPSMENSYLGCMNGRVYSAAGGNADMMLKCQPLEDEIDFNSLTWENRPQTSSVFSPFNIFIFPYSVPAGHTCFVYPCSISFQVQGDVDVRALRFYVDSTTEPSSDYFFYFAGWLGLWYTQPLMVYQYPSVRTVYI